MRDRIPLAAVTVSWSIIYPGRFVQLSGRAFNSLQASELLADEQEARAWRAVSIWSLAPRAAKILFHSDPPSA